MTNTHPPKSFEEHVYNAIHPTFANKQKHLGMPAFDDSVRPLSFYEFWPTKGFYIPIAVHFLWLLLRHAGPTLPTIANPHFLMGGFVGESKQAIFEQFGDGLKDFTVKSVALSRRADDSDGNSDAAQLKALMQSKGISYPTVIKPDMGCRGVGVQLLRTDADLRCYLQNFPAGGGVVVQELVPYEGEAGIFYVRLPNAEQGFIFSITLKYFPYVVGDGNSSLLQLIEKDKRAGTIKHVYLQRHAHRLHEIIPEGQNFRLAFTGSHSRGTIFRNGNAYTTEKMRQCFDKLARHIPEFYFGRFDVRFADYRQLQQGRGFKIVEINGAGAEATHIWDSRTSIFKAYKTLFKQNALLFEIAAQNRKRGFKPASLWALFKAYCEEKRLTANYPITE